jgi:hypothetical protein
MISPYYPALYFHKLLKAEFILLAGPFAVKSAYSRLAVHWR